MLFNFNNKTFPRAFLVNFRGDAINRSATPPSLTGDWVPTRGLNLKPLSFNLRGAAIESVPGGAWTVDEIRLVGCRDAKIEGVLEDLMKEFFALDYTGKDSDYTIGNQDSHFVFGSNADATSDTDTGFGAASSSSFGSVPFSPAIRPNKIRSVAFGHGHSV